MGKKVKITAIFVAIIITSLIANQWYKKYKLERAIHILVTMYISGDGKGLWNNSTEWFKKTTIKVYGSQERFLASTELAAEIFKNVKSWKIEHYIDFGERATVPITIINENKSEDHIYFYLAKSNESWKLFNIRVRE